MQNQTQVFENKAFGRLEVVLIDGKPYFPATECAKMLGYKNPRDAISKHCKADGVAKRDGVSVTTNQHGISTNQTVELTYISEGNLYRLIIRSKLPDAVKFEAWVCDEVLPSIRRHGAYITEATIRRMSESAAYADELIQRLSAELSDEQSKNAVLSNYVNSAAPKVRYYDIILQCPGAVQVSIIAKDYGYSAVAFNKLLHALGVQYKVGRTWLLYSEYANKGYTVTKTYEIDGKIASILTCFTQRGRFWLYNLLKAQGILPITERNSPRFSYASAPAGAGYIRSVS